MTLGRHVQTGYVTAVPGSLVFEVDRWEILSVKKQEAGGGIKELPVTTASKVQQALDFFQNMTFDTLSFLFRLTFSFPLIYLCTDYTVSISPGHFFVCEKWCLRVPLGAIFYSHPPL